MTIMPGSASDLARQRANKRFYADLEQHMAEVQAGTREPAEYTGPPSGPDAMSWSPQEGDEEMESWQSLFHDRRQEGRRHSPQ